MRRCGGERTDGAVCVVCHCMADQRTGSSVAIVRNRHPAVRSNNIQVEVNEPVTAHRPISACDSVRRVTSRTRKTRIDVNGMLRPACVLDDVAGKIMAFAAHRVRPIHREIRIWKKVGDALPGTRRLAEFVTSLQDVGPFRSVRAARTQPAEFAVVITVVTIRAENLNPHLPSLTRSVQLRHVRQQTGLRVSRGTSVRYRMA